MGEKVSKFTCRWSQNLSLTSPADDPNLKPLSRVYLIYWTNWKSCRIPTATVLIGRKKKLLAAVEMVLVPHCWFPIEKQLSEKANTKMGELTETCLVMRMNEDRTHPCSASLFCSVLSKSSPTAKLELRRYHHRWKIKTCCSATS